MGKKALEMLVLLFCLVAMTVMFGGFGMWLLRDYPWFTENAGAIAIVGFVMAMFSGFLLTLVSPPPKVSEEKN